MNLDLNQVVGAIVTKEWEMFHNVNGDDRVECQENPVMFSAMRRAQFSAWSRDAAYSYLQDLMAAEAEGRNLPREKYIHMMKSTDPKGYGELSHWLPRLTAHKEELVGKIWNEHMLQQTIRLRDQYPHFVMGGRPMRTMDETGGDTSIETYWTSELLTYSERTLELLLEHIIDLEKKGIEFARVIQENTVKAIGFETLEEAEAEFRMQYAKARMNRRQFSCANCN